MNNNTGLPEYTPLGTQTIYEDSYNPKLLCPVSRVNSRQSLRLVDSESLPFRGEDRWTAYEVSWLTESGKPCIAVAELVFPCDSFHIIESKSLKLYLNSLNQTVASNASMS